MAGVIPVVIGLVCLVALIPLFLGFVDNAKNSVRHCPGADPAHTVLDTTYNLCTNSSGVGSYNSTALSVGLSSAESTMLGLIVTLLGIGFVVFVISKARAG